MDEKDYEVDLEVLMEMSSIVNDPMLTVKVQRALLRHKCGCSEATIEALCPATQVRY